jgi:hypothetical protein
MFLLKVTVFKETATIIIDQITQTPIVAQCQGYAIRFSQFFFISSTIIGFRTLWISTGTIFYFVVVAAINVGLFPSCSLSHAMLSLAGKSEKVSVLFYTNNKMYSGKSGCHNNNTDATQSVLTDEYTYSST